MVIPGAFGYLPTGGLYAPFTGGLFRRWSIFKWIATVAMILFSMIYLGPWEQQRLDRAASPGWQLFKWRPISMPDG